MRMTAKRPARTRKSARPAATYARLKKDWAHFRKSRHFVRVVGAGATFVVVLAVLAAAAMVGARGPASPSDASVAAQHASSADSRRTGYTGGPASLPPTAPVLDEKHDDVKKASKPVTIAGCLVRDDRTFRLRDTTGTDAPKGRSWKSGFLKKNASAVDVIDTDNRLKLPTHVGQRVSVTGQLENREMRARSLQLVSASCG